MISNLKQLTYYSLRSLQFLWRKSKAYVLLTFLEILTTSVGVFPGIYLTGFSLEMLMQKISFRRYLNVIMILTVMIFLIQIFNKVISTCLIQVKQKMYLHIQMEINSICLRTAYENIQSKCFQENKEFALASLKENCLDLFVQSVKKLISSLLILTGVLYILSSTSLWILIPMLISLLLGFCYDYLNAHQNFTELKERTEYRRKSGYLYTISRDFSYAKEIRLFQLKDRFRSRMDEVEDLLFRLHEARRKQKQPSAALYYLSDMFLTAAVYLYLGFQVLVTESLSPGGFTTCHQALRQLKVSLEDIIYVMTNFVVHTEYLKSLFTFLDQKSPEFSAFEVSRCTEAQIRFEHVSFRYPSAMEDTLHDINITIENGEKLLIVGENGAGKSTFIKLLCGLYKPTHGTIYLNGTDISTLEPRQYMRQISAVFQDYRLFAFSIKENFNALYADGLEFSGGEMQKLAIARAIDKDAPILVLDEPTSALDPKAEHEIIENFQNISQNRTTVFISHRLTSAAFSDRIAVFSEGRIVEYGTHKELINRHGIYADLYSIQAGLYRKEESL